MGRHGEDAVKHLDAKAAQFLGGVVRTLKDWDAHGPKPPKYLKRWFTFVEDRSALVVTKEVGGRTSPTTIPSYSLEIAAAWDLYREIHRLDPTAYVKGTEVWLFNDHFGVGHIASGESAAEAIARAAAWLHEVRGLTAKVENAQKREVVH